MASAAGHPPPEGARIRSASAAASSPGPAPPALSQYSRDLMGSLESARVPSTQEAAVLAAADDDIPADCGRDDARAAVERRKKIHGAEQSDTIFADIFQKVNAKEGRLSQVRA
eukprot:6100624-Pyramimonas_sp.AAC.1